MEFLDEAFGPYNMMTARHCNLDPAIGLPRPMKPKYFFWPPYSPDYSVCDFYLWPNAKQYVNNRRWYPKNKTELLARIREYFEIFYCHSKLSNAFFGVDTGEGPG